MSISIALSLSYAISGNGSGHLGASVNLYMRHGSIQSRNSALILGSASHAASMMRPAEQYAPSQCIVRSGGIKSVYICCRISSGKSKKPVVGLVDDDDLGDDTSSSGSFLAMSGCFTTGVVLEESVKRKQSLGS